MATQTVIAGINLPPMVGSTNNGAFSTKALANSYTEQQVRDTIWQKKGIRIAINPPTVSDATQWTNTQNMANWALDSGGSVVFCMWDSNLINGVPSTDNLGHGDGKVDNLPLAKSMWNTVAKAYQNNANVYFEAFNEPFGYKDPTEYMSAMLQIIPDNIPVDRIILDGMGYAADVQSIKDLWHGLLGYHVYPNWHTGGLPTQAGFSNLVQRHLAGVAHRTMVTEFGADVSLAEDYQNSFSTNADVQFLKGMEDAFKVLRPMGTFIWHGWHNNDAYGYWTAKPTAKAKIDLIQAY